MLPPFREEQEEELKESAARKGAALNRVILLLKPYVVDLQLSVVVYEERGAYT